MHRGSAAVITDHYDFEEVLGKGAFGSVQRVKHRENGQHYACKLLKVEALRLSHMKREVVILKECRHPNIIFLKEARTPACASTGT